MKNLKDILNEFISRFADENEFYSVRCRIKSVNLDLYTCQVETISENNLIDDVQLSSNIGAKFGIFIIPVVGSTAIVSFNSKNDAFISKTGEIEKFLFLFDEGTTIEINSGEIILNDGSFDGLIKINELTTRLNELENLFTTLQNNFNSWVTAPNDGGAALKAVLTSPPNGFNTKQVPDSKKEDYENEIIKHGTI